MQEAVAARAAPVHLWIIGILSLLWNAFGAYDYTMTKLRNTDYLASMGDAQGILNYVDALPMYAHVGWGLGVWGALLGSILLLMRSRYAVHAFALSIIGMALSFGGQYLGGVQAPAEMTQGMMKYIPLLIVIIGLAQFWYAWRAAKDGVLR